MNNWKRYMLYATNMDPQILVMWTRSSSNVAKYLSDTITDQIRIFISHDPVEECSNNYIWEWNMLEVLENDRFRKKMKMEQIIMMIILRRLYLRHNYL